MIRACLLVTVALAVTILTLGCERPFTERRPPDIGVLSPNLNVVQIDSTILVRIQTVSINSVDSVVINGSRMAPESVEGVFRLEVSLARGINRMIVRAFGSDGTIRADTLVAVHLPGESDLADLRLPLPRGGHTATRLRTGDLLVAGGAEHPNSGAVDEVLRFDSQNLGAPPTLLHMAGPRMEHTATRLPDGSVILIGGSVVSRPTFVEQLVERIELYEPGVDSVREIPVRGDPVRRSSHTAALFPVRRSGVVEIYLYLFGGYGDIAYRPEPRMGVRSDLRVFQFRNDSLVAVGPTFGPYIDAMADHSGTELRPPFVGSNTEYLIGGSYFASEENYDSYAFESEFALGIGILIDDLEPMTPPRWGHAAERLVDGEIIVLGGRTFATTTAMGLIEVYESRLKRFFPFPAGVEMIQERWGHSATNWSEDRILIVGGFGHAGAGLPTSEWFTVLPRSQ